jgi:hypothetical protein
MSPSPPLPSEGAGAPGAADLPEDPLRISPEMMIPASTGNSFFKMLELTPENLCA